MQQHLDPSTDETVQSIVSWYYDLDNFHINNFNIDLLNKINSFFSKLPLYKYYYQPQSSDAVSPGSIIFMLDFEILKNQNAETFLVFIKYIQTFAEESFVFIKVILHLYLLRNKNKTKIYDVTPSTKLTLQIKNAYDIFLIDSSSKLKVNSYAQFYCHISHISSLKKINSKVNYICSRCGVISSKNLLLNENNSTTNTNAIPYHLCEPDAKIFKEFTLPIYIRYLHVDFNNEKILCRINEENFDMKLLTNTVKISGLVKVRSENSKNENWFIKYINITQIEPQVNKDHILPNVLSHVKSDDNVTKLTVFTWIKHKFSYCFHNLLPKIDYNHILLFYFLFSSGDDGTNLKIHFINTTKNELSNVFSIKRWSSQYPSIFTYISNYDSKAILSNINTKIENDAYINYPSANLVIGNYDNKCDGYIKNIVNNINASFALYSNSNTNTNNSLPNTGSKSIITISNSFDITWNGYDCITIINEMNDWSNDRKKSNLIIQNQFRRKRNMNNTRKDLDNTQFNQVDKINSFSDEQDLYSLDAMSWSDYFKNEIIIDEESDEPIFSRDIIPSIDIYINFVNKYVTPVIPMEAYNDIYFLSEHWKQQFSDLQSYPLFDINWVSINCWVKFAKISARIDMREMVNKEDIVKAYFITKEFLQQNYVYCLLNKKDKVKGKKGKINYIIEKLKQYSIFNGKTISITEIKTFGGFNEEEYNEWIERWNYEGVLLKLNSQEFQISAN